MSKPTRFSTLWVLNHVGFFLISRVWIGLFRSRIMFSILAHALSPLLGATYIYWGGGGLGLIIVIVVIVLILR